MKCKATSWIEVDADFIATDNSTYLFTCGELGIVNVLDELPETINQDGRKVKIPETFILLRGNNWYACKREGYNYIRYIHRIK